MRTLLQPRDQFLELLVGRQQRRVGRLLLRVGLQQPRVGLQQLRDLRTQQCAMSAMPPRACKGGVVGVHQVRHTHLHTAHRRQGVCMGLACAVCCACAVHVLCMCAVLCMCMCCACACAVRVSTACGASNHNNNNTSLRAPYRFFQRRDAAADGNLRLLERTSVVPCRLGRSFEVCGAVHARARAPDIHARTPKQSAQGGAEVAQRAVRREAGKQIGGLGLASGLAGGPKRACKGGAGHRHRGKNTAGVAAAGEWSPLKGFFGVGLAAATVQYTAALQRSGRGGNRVHKIGGCCPVASKAPVHRCGLAVDGALERRELRRQLLNVGTRFGDLGARGRAVGDARAHEPGLVAGACHATGKKASIVTLTRDDAWWSVSVDPAGECGLGGRRAFGTRPPCRAKTKLN